MPRSVQTTGAGLFAFCRKRRRKSDSHSRASTREIDRKEHIRLAPGRTTGRWAAPWGICAMLTRLRSRVKQLAEGPNVSVRPRISNFRRSVTLAIARFIAIGGSAIAGLAGRHATGANQSSRACGKADFVAATRSIAARTAVGHTRTTALGKLDGLVQCQNTVLQGVLGCSRCRDRGTKYEHS